MKNRFNHILLLFAIASIPFLNTSCDKDQESLTVNIKNNSTQTITAYTVETGSKNMSEDAIYVNSIASENSLAPGAGTKVIIEVPDNGTGDFEAVKLTVTVNGKKYAGEDSFLFFNDQGNSTVSNANISDSSVEGEVIVSIDIEW